MGYLQDLYEGDREIVAMQGLLVNDKPLIDSLVAMGLFVVYTVSAVFGRQTDAYMGSAIKLLGAFKRKEDIPESWVKLSEDEDQDPDYYYVLLSPPEPEQPEEPNTGWDYGPF